MQETTKILDIQTTTQKYKKNTNNTKLIKNTIIYYKYPNK